MIPSPSPDPSNEDACRTAAAQLQRDHRNWLVMWGCYTHTYVAFPLFHAPRGTVLTATAPGELAAKMRRQERSARVPQPREWQEPGVPPQGGPPGWPEDEGSPGWPGHHSLLQTGRPARAPDMPTALAGGLPAPLVRDGAARAVGTR